MESNTSNNAGFIVITGLLIAIGRIVLGNVEFDDGGINILIVMAILNYVALGFVFLFLHNGFVQDFNKRLEKSGLNTSQKDSRKKTRKLISFLLLLLYGILGASYICFFYNADFNDAFSIIALSISIANDGIVEALGKKYYLVIGKIANKSNHRHEKKE